MRTLVPLWVFHISLLPCSAVSQKQQQEGEEQIQGSAVLKHMYEGAAEHASETMHRLQRLAHDMARSQWLHNLTVVCILINTLTMCINW